MDSRLIKGDLVLKFQRIPSSLVYVTVMYLYSLKSLHRQRMREFCSKDFLLTCVACDVTF